MACTLIAARPNRGILLPAKLNMLRAVAATLLFPARAAFTVAETILVDAIVALAVSKKGTLRLDAAFNWLVPRASRGTAPFVIALDTELNVACAANCRATDVAWRPVEIAEVLPERASANDP